MRGDGSNWLKGMLLSHRCKLLVDLSLKVCFEGNSADPLSGSPGDLTPSCEAASTLSANRQRFCLHQVAPKRALMTSMLVGLR